MNELSRVTLINALIKTYPDRPRAYFDVMDDAELRIAFQQVANEHATVLRQFRSISY